MCRFLDKDGHCAFHSDDEVKEYCVAGPCPDMQTYNELIDALLTCGGDAPTDCGKCNYDGDFCMSHMLRDAADAIELLIAENKELKKKVDDQDKKKIQELNKEIERLKGICDIYGKVD